jgi:hypothetical protein
MTVHYLEATGDAGVGLARHRELHDRMIPLLRFTTTDGRQFQIKLTVDDLRGIGHDVIRLFSADRAEVSSWWSRLADGADGRPRAALVPPPSDGVPTSPTEHAAAGNSHP